MAASTEPFEIQGVAAGSASPASLQPPASASQIAPPPAEEPARGPSVGEYANRAHASDRIYDAYAQTQRAEQPPAARSADPPLEKQVARREAEARKRTVKDDVRGKMDAVRILHGGNVRFTKEIKDTRRVVHDLNVASHMTENGPDYLQQRMGAVVAQGESVGQSMTDMVSQMQRIRTLNQDIVKAGEGAKGTFDDPEDPQRALTGQAQADNLNVGSYMFEWTRESLQQGVEELDAAATAMERSFRTAKNAGAPDADSRRDASRHDNGTSPYVHKYVQEGKWGDSQPLDLKALLQDNPRMRELYHREGLDRRGLGETEQRERLLEAASQREDEKTYLTAEPLGAKSLAAQAAKLRQALDALSRSGPR